MWYKTLRPSAKNGKMWRIIRCRNKHVRITQDWPYYVTLCTAVTLVREPSLRYWHGQDGIDISVIIIIVKHQPIKILGITLQQFAMWLKAKPGTCRLVSYVRVYGYGLPVGLFCIVCRRSIGVLGRRRLRALLYSSRSLFKACAIALQATEATVRDAISVMNMTITGTGQRTTFPLCWKLEFCTNLQLLFSS